MLYMICNVRVYTLLHINYDVFRDIICVVHFIPLEIDVSFVKILFSEQDTSLSITYSHILLVKYVVGIVRILSTSTQWHELQLMFWIFSAFPLCFIS